MATCPSCGRENPVGSRFCNACGTELAPATEAREYRKVVTVLFCDVVGSTALGESTDPEALRALLGRYFGEMHWFGLNTGILTARRPERVRPGP